MTSDPQGAAAAAMTGVLVVRAAERAAIVVRGKDRISWLNGLVTCDLAKLGPEDAAYGLIVEKKGRIQTDFIAVSSRNERVHELALAVPSTLREAVVETLDHYLIMEDAELEAVDLAFWHLHGPAAHELSRAAGASFAGGLNLLGSGGAVVAVTLADADAFGARLADLTSERNGVIADDATWESVRIERGLPRFGVEVDATLYPQEASLEKLAVSFDKGCYLGQEVVYMLENRGHVKRKLVSLTIEDGGEPLSAGAPVTTAEGAPVGEVKSTCRGASGSPAAIAMVKWAQTKPGTELRVGDRMVRVRASDRA